LASRAKAHLRYVIFNFPIIPSISIRDERFRNLSIQTSKTFHLEHQQDNSTIIMDIYCVDTIDPMARCIPIINEME